MKSSALWALFVAAAIGIPSLQAAEPPRSKIKRFVTEIAGKPEYGSKERVASRWTVMPKVSVFGANRDQLAIIQEVLATISRQLPPESGEIKILAENSPEANLKIYLAPMRRLEKIAKANGFPYHANDSGTFWMFWNDRHEITSAIVLLATDRLTEKNFRHFAFEEIIQSFGLANDSKEFEESIFFSRGSDGGNAPSPAALDLLVLQWYYRQIQPGDSSKTIAQKFDETWPKEK